MTDDTPPTGLVAEGLAIPDAIVAGLVQRMREAPFRANQIEGEAARALREAGLDAAPAMRLADRLIQRYRRAGRLTMRRDGRSPTFIWRD
jgi:hypothetical protein